LNRALDSLDIVAARIQTAFGALSIEKFDLQIRKHVEIGCAQLDRLSECGIPGEQTLGPRYIAHRSERALEFLFDPEEDFRGAAKSCSR
jgi:hypothetical protein